MLSLVSIALFVGVLAAVYWLGVTQGRHVMKKRMQQREYRIAWMLREALHRWTPWDREPQEAWSRLSEEYEELRERQGRVRVR